MSAEIIHGDCLDVLRSMPDGSVDAVIADPPYGINYADWDKTVPPQSVLAECLRVSRGPVIWFGGPQTRVMREVLAYTPPPDRMLVWHVTFSLGASRANGAFFRWHPIWCWRLPNKQDVIKHDVLPYRTDGRNWWNHPATKPQGLMRALVGAFSPDGGTVLDCYAGSGSTGVAAMTEGRSFIGIEREAAYVEIARKRIADAQAQLGLGVA